MSAGVVMHSRVAGNAGVAQLYPYAVSMHLINPVETYGYNCCLITKNE